MTRTRILLVDDHPVVRQGLRSLLSTVSDFEVVGEADSAAAAIEAVESSRPDVILLDIRMRGQDGIHAARHLRRAAPDARVVILTVHDDPEYVSRALEAGVNGYLLKNSASAEIVGVIRRIVAGERVVAPELAAGVLDNYVELVQKQARDDADISDEELRILDGMSTGMSYKDIADSLYLSEITVRRRVQELYRKLAVKDRAEAVAVAIRRGLI